MDKNKIPVVWGLDKNFILQSFVVMRSILKNSHEQFLFILLTADSIENEVKGLEAILKKDCPNFEISIRKIRMDFLENVKIYNEQLSKATYFRLLIPDLVPEYDKCIYLDCDLIVNGNILELYEVDLKHDLLAGVMDCHIIEETQYQREHQQILGIPSRNKYVNAGVLILNLKKMREKKLSSFFMARIEKENWYEDQDILNYCCYPFIKTLPLKYNLFHFYQGKNIKFLYHLPYTKEDFDFNSNTPFILHMGSSYKPWNSCQVKGSREWWQLAEVFRECESYQYYAKKCQNEETLNEIQDLIKQAEKSRKIVIWGYTKAGKQLCDIFLDYGLDNIAVIADNNHELWGSKYRGIPIHGLTSIKDGTEDIFWFIACRKAYDEIAAQLKRHGVEEKNMYHYVNHHEERMYLLSLHESAYEKEIGYIADIEYVRQIPDVDKRISYIKQIISNPKKYVDEYEYLDKKYIFKYWIGMQESSGEQE